MHRMGRDIGKWLIETLQTEHCSFEVFLVSFRKKCRACNLTMFTTQKIKFSMKDFFSKCDQIRRKLRIWSHLFKKSLMENFIFVQ